MEKTTRTKPGDPFSSTFAYWSSWSRACEIWWTRGMGTGAVDAARQKRFHTLVRFARSRSPFYRDAYRRLPERDLDPRDLPAVTKQELMGMALTLAVAHDRTVVLGREPWLVILSARGRVWGVAFAFAARCAPADSRPWVERSR